MRRKRIYYLSLVFVLIPFINIAGQITLDLGPDTTLCIPVKVEDKILLDPDIVLFDAQEPVEYSWECTYMLTDDYTLHASDFLDDTTSMSPEIIDWLTTPDWISFYLEVKDNDGNIARDTMRIRFSVFAYTLGGFGLYVHHGDSAQLSGEFIGGGIAPLTYTWTPEIFLSDVNDPAPWCKPDSDMIYSQFAVDSVGCISEPNEAFHIFHIPSAVENDVSANGPFIQNGSILEFLADIVLDGEILIFSLTGKLLGTIKQKPVMDLSDYTSQPGVNIACFSINGEEYYVKFINDK